ncbi:MAG: hypothetical protein PHV20_09415 [Bacteroidales bacterium]|nr:hypothetical protein [Bacteroidales bacterium]
MRLEIPYSNIQEYIYIRYHRNIRIKNSEVDKIRISYFISFILTIEEVKPDEVIFRYKANMIVNLLLKSIRFLLKNKLENTPVKWDSHTREVVIDLKKVKELTKFLKFSFISELHFADEATVLIIDLKSIS